MAMASFPKEARELIAKDLELEIPEDVLTEEQLLEVLARQVDWMLEYRTEYLFSLLYRLDVSEEQVNRALRPDAPEPGNVGVARLILERQKKRWETKKAYKPPPIDGWDSFDWS
jgi:hypothetical protein